MLTPNSFFMGETIFRTVSTGMLLAYYVTNVSPCVYTSFLCKANRYWQLRSAEMP